MKIRSGPYEVLEAGSVYSFEHSPISFHMDENVVLTFTFINDTENTKTRFTFESEGPHDGKFIMYNFNNPLGDALTKPINLGSIGGRALYVFFSVSTVETDIMKDGGNKLMHYTFYLGEEVDNG